MRVKDSRGKLFLTEDILEIHALGRRLEARLMVQGKGVQINPNIIDLGGPGVGPEFP